MIDNKYHFEGQDKQGKKIIIDISDLNNVSQITYRAGRYEVMAMYANGHEINYKRFLTLDSAVEMYEHMIDIYTLKPGENAPLNGKYAKLRDDLKTALAVAEKAASGVEDTGTCNLDACALQLPRWREILIKQAAEEAGTSCFTWTLFGSKRYVFIPRVSGQAYKREIAAERMTEEMNRLGYDTFTYQQAD